MKKYKGYLIDLDGTMYRGNAQVEAAGDFVQLLQENNIPHLFVTNNSSRTPEQIADKLVGIGIPATGEQVFTTSNATANYMYDLKKNASVYIIGENGIEEALVEKGFRIVDENPDFVVVGIDRSVNYEKFAKACLAVRNGATFISTNGDIAFPTERGLLPGNGSLTSVITVSTTVQPIFIGKPESIIIEQALDVLGVPREDVLMVGDNYDTDIKAGMNAGIDTLLVHTGVTTQEHLNSYEEKPTYTVNTLKEWFESM